MAAQIMQGGGGRRNRRSYYARPVSEINVTPFVDVMLVLLVVFMVTAPMLTVAVPVDLPKTQARSLNQDKDPLVISIDSAGKVYLQEKRLELADLVPKLKAITNANADARIFVRGDQGVTYGRIMEVMGTVSAAGFNKVALVAELPKPGAAPGNAAMSMPEPTMNDDGMKDSLIASAVLHLAVLLFLYFGLPHLMPPLPEPHAPVPFQIVEIAELTNTRVKEEEPTPQPPAPQPPPPEVKPPEQAAPPPPPTPDVPKPAPAPEPEAMKAAPVPKEKPKPPDAKPQTEEFNKLLKNLETNKKTDAPKVTETKPDSKAQAQPAPAPASSLSSRLTISEEDALRRQIENCWNPPIGARDAQSLIVELIINVSQDRTVIDTDVVDKGRYASDSYFRAAADAATRAVRNPRCSPLELPADKYDQWKRIDFIFDPRDML